MAIKFLRKNMKVIMVALGVPIMIAFLLPSMMGQQGQQDARRAQEYGTYKDAEGQDVIVTTAELASTNTHIEILRDLGAALMGQLIIYPVNPQLTQQLTAAYAQMGISPSTVMATQLIFFGDAQVASIAQSQLSRSIGRLAKTQKDAEQLSKQIGDLIGVDSARGRLYYLLLAEEAHRAGIYATAAQVENFKAICANFGQKSGQIARAKGLSSEQMNSIIATYIAILRHGDAVTRTMAVSEPQLKNIVRDMVESENITGRYVEFSRQRYQDKIAEPTADDLKKHFDTFKSNIPGEVSPDDKDQNPFGFGYVLPDRVKVEFLKVNFEDAKNVAISDFDKLSISDQEETLLDVYRKNKSNFEKRLPAADDGSTPEPTYSPYDEVVSDVKNIYINQQTQLKVSRVLDEAAKLIKSAADAGQPANYEEIAKKISSIEIPVESRQSDFLSYTTAQTFENFGQASRMRKNQQGPPLLASLFNCQPLRKTSISRYEEPAVKLFEDITGVQNDQAAYTVRILAVDKQRDPVSLDDDGRQGSAAIDPMTDNSSTVKEQVTTDWKNLKAYQMACEQAEAFAELAADDFDAAIEKTNASLKSDDPNDPVLKLQEGDLEKDRTQMESLVNRVAELRQQIRDYPNLANYISGTMNQSQQMIAQYNQQFNEAMKRAQELKAAPSKRPLLKRPQAFACRVFENLTVTPPYQEDYNRRKAIVAQSLQHQFQDLYIVIHYNPENIEKRMKYDDIVREKADDEAKNE